MRLFKKKSPPPIPYDPATQEPAVRSSICTGEMVVGFADRGTGKFREYELARSQSDVDAFCRRVGIEPKDIKRIY